MLEPPEAILQNHLLFCLAGWALFASAATINHARKRLDRFRMLLQPRTAVFLVAGGYGIGAVMSLVGGG